MEKKTTLIVMAFTSLLVLASCGGQPNDETNNSVNDTIANSDVENNQTKHAIMAGCKGDACGYVELSATFNSQRHITSITVDNVSSLPVNIQIEFQTLFSDIEPWSKYKIPANRSKTYSIDPGFQYMGASIKRANEITN